MHLEEKQEPTEASLPLYKRIGLTIGDFEKYPGLKNALTNVELEGLSADEIRDMAQDIFNLGHGHQKAACKLIAICPPLKRIPALQLMPNLVLTFYAENPDRSLGMGPGPVHALICKTTNELAGSPEKRKELLDFLMFFKIDRRTQILATMLLEPTLPCKAVAQILVELKEGERGNHIKLNSVFDDAFKLLKTNEQRKAGLICLTQIFGELVRSLNADRFSDGHVQKEIKSVCKNLQKEGLMEAKDIAEIDQILNGAVFGEQHATKELDITEDEFGDPRTWPTSVHKALAQHDAIGALDRLYATADEATKAAIKQALACLRDDEAITYQNYLDLMERFV